MAFKLPDTWRRMPPLPTTRDLLRIYNIRAKKSLSQNFIMDPRILQKFVKVAGKIDGHVAIEVGPGPGGITRAILDAGVKECHVVEKDPRFLPSLKLIKHSVGPERLHISIGDCLHYNITKMLEEKVQPVTWDSPQKPALTIFGNLPFNVATPFLIRLIKSISDQSNFFTYGRATSVLCFQHEVAMRMCAPEQNSERCRLSVMCQNWADVHYAFNLPGGAFVPPPQVEVGVVRLTPLREPFIDLPFAFVDQVVNALFLGGKNKYVNTTLKTIFLKHGVSPKEARELVKELLKRCDIDPNSTAVALSLSDIKALCFGYKLLLETHPSLKCNASLDDDDVAHLEADSDIEYVGEQTLSLSVVKPPTKYVVQF